jgi:hypothetical protein
MGPDARSKFALPSAGQARFSGYHSTAAFASSKITP